MPARIGRRAIPPLQPPGPAAIGPGGVAGQGRTGRGREPRMNTDEHGSGNATGRPRAGRRRIARLGPIGLGCPRRGVENQMRPRSGLPYRVPGRRDPIPLGPMGRTGPGIGSRGAGTGHRAYSLPPLESLSPNCPHVVWGGQRKTPGRGEAATFKQWMRRLPPQNRLGHGNRPSTTTPAGEKRLEASPRGTVAKVSLEARGRPDREAPDNDGTTAAIRTCRQLSANAAPLGLAPNAVRLSGLGDDIGDGA
jgi:hypothetical protein